MIKLYGIKNCDTMKKAFSWCEERSLPYQFHDYKKSGVPLDRLTAWCETAGWEKLLNRKGTTYRKLSPAQQAVATQDAAVMLMMENPSLIKRPVVEANGQLLVGFDPELFGRIIR
ncbi:MAG: ArsC family reductase [Proteobacteria bacterium]|nr:ArsC family reductase [Pseudomonadota bacterium]HQR03300.1 ArsC family reductase [Rhodocyclaceae bacterium]